MTDLEHIIVIGAGAAGLAAARRVHDAGTSVVVLEARDRVGGRAWTGYDIAAHPVELGAEFVHGENVCTWEHIGAFGLRTLDQFPLMNVRAFVNDALLEQAAFLGAPNMTLAWKMHRYAAEWIVAGHADASIAEASRDWSGFFDRDHTPDDWRLFDNMVARFHAAGVADVGVAGLLGVHVRERRRAPAFPDRRGLLGADGGAGDRARRPAQHAHRSRRMEPRRRNRPNCIGGVPGAVCRDHAVTSNPAGGRRDLRAAAAP